jgi:hypothetical protein
MKTFKGLTVGETFYMVYTNYEGKEKPKWREIIVSRIEVGEKDKVKCLMINQRSGYGSGYYYDFVLPLDKCNTDTVENGNQGFFTTDYSVLVKLLSKAGLKYIQEVEAEIDKKKEEVKKIRVAYWDYLNNLTKEPILETESVGS